MAAILASVVIPCKDGQRLLDRVLVGLSNQSVHPDDFEIVVIDDGSQTPLTCPDDIANLRVYRNEASQGAGRSRNLGAALTKAECLIFLDADCIPAPNLVAAFAEALRLEQADALCGRTYCREITPDIWRTLYGELEPSLELISRIRPTYDQLISDPLASIPWMQSEFDWAFMWTHNIAMRRTAFEKVGGFSAKFAGKGVEDMELGYRLRQAGYRISYFEDGTALHQPHPRQRRNEVISDRSNEALLLEMHPSITVESVCAFDMMNSLRHYADLSVGLQLLRGSDLDFSRLNCIGDYFTEYFRADSEVLWLGAANDVARKGQTVVSPLHDGCTGREQGCHVDTHRLLGVKLPFRDQKFHVGVVGDWVNILPERTSSRILQEMLRVCNRVYVTTGLSRSVATRAARHELEKVLNQLDRPYWEAYLTLARERFSFSRELLGADVSDGRAWSIAEIKPIPLPRP